MNPHKRALVGFVLAPLLPALVFAFLALLASWVSGESLNLTDLLLGTLALAAWVLLYAYVGIFIVAVPAFLLLQRFATPRLWHALLIGATTGAALATIMSRGHWTTVVFGALIGFATARAFWAYYVLPEISRSGAA